jgi:hypothetical protein
VAKPGPVAPEGDLIRIPTLELEDRHRRELEVLGLAVRTAENEPACDVFDVGLELEPRAERLHRGWHLRPSLLAQLLAVLGERLFHHSHMATTSHVRAPSLVISEQK